MTSSASNSLLYSSLDIFWLFLFSAMITVSIVGNAIVLWIVAAHRRMWSVTNSFIVNLSVLDLLNTVFNCSFGFFSMWSNNWIFGFAFCRANHFFSYSTVSASSFTLSAISYDRHISILRPNCPKLGRGAAVAILALIWISSIIIAVVPSVYSKLHQVKLPTGETVHYCLLVWPDGPPAISFYDYAFNILFTLITYLVPMFQMLISYSHISVVLWRSKGLGDSPSSPAAAAAAAPTSVTYPDPAAAAAAAAPPVTVAAPPTNGFNRRDSYTAQQNERAIVNKRKIVKMFMVVVLTFCFCWFPYHAYFLYTYHNKEVITSPVIHHIYLGFYWLAMANSAINPIIYYFMSARFRFYFRSLMMNLRRSFGQLLFLSSPPSDSSSFEMENILLVAPPPLGCREPKQPQRQQQQLSSPPPLPPQSSRQQSPLIQPQRRRQRGQQTPLIRVQNGRDRL